MIDYGTYQIQKDGDKFVVVEQVSGKEKEFDSIADILQFIEQDLNDVENGNT